MKSAIEKRILVLLASLWVYGLTVVTSDHLNAPSGSQTLEEACGGSSECKERLELCVKEEWGWDDSTINLGTQLKRVATLPLFSKFKTELHNECGYDLNFENGIDYGEGFTTKSEDLKFSGDYAIQASYMKKKDEVEDEGSCLTDPENGSGLCEISYNSLGGEEEVDLLVEPEAYTGYPASHSHKIWSCVYGFICTGNEQNILSSGTGFATRGVDEVIHEHCDSDNALYRLVSGIHTSISIHLCKRWCGSNDPVWRNNLECYMYRVGHYQYRKDNFFFLSSLVNLALKKSAKSLLNIAIHKGNLLKGETYHELMHSVNLLVTALNQWQPNVGYEETILAIKRMKELTRSTSSNVEVTISKIFDCIKCTKCRLWGKLQIKGLRNAIDIFLKPEGENLLITLNDMIALLNLANNLHSSTKFMCEFDCMLNKGKQQSISTTRSAILTFLVSLGIPLSTLFTCSRTFKGSKSMKNKQKTSSKIIGS